MNSYIKVFEYQHFEEGDLPQTIENTVFRYCDFKGNLPDFRLCEFHNCDLRNTRVARLLSCKLFSTKLDGANFSKADVRFSITNAGSTCSARNCEWQGISATLDCGFFSGLQVDEKDAEFFLIMAILPNSPLKRTLFKTFSDNLKVETRRRVSRDFRKC